jgi:H/ACA ribonucleoprotein complex subunit 4
MVSGFIMKNNKLNKKSIKELFEFSIINIDKPTGPTSFKISEIIKKKLGLKKTSHFGTLDPKVTGVLPIALNRACRLLGFFISHNKTYVGVMHVNNPVSIKKLQEIINKNFIGRIKQIPPQKSRVRRQEREREVFSFKILEKQDKYLLFKTEVQGGTYIRKLIHDLGQEKEVGGAHMTELRRVKAGIFSENGKWPIVDMYKFQKAIEEYKKGKEDELRSILIPAENAIEEIMPCIQIKKDKNIFNKLLIGKPLMKQDIKVGGKLPEGRFAVFYEDSFIEVAHKVSEGDIIARPEFVLN